MFFEMNTSDFKELLPGFRVKFVHTDHLTIAHWIIEAGAELPEHSHVHEMVVNVIEGRFELNLDGKTHVLEQGNVLVVPSSLPHSGRALTDCRIIDVFYPVREDYRTA